MAPQALMLLLALAVAGLAGVQAPASPAAPPAPARAAGPELSDAAIETFLRKARVLRTRETGKGITGSLRATLSDGTLTHEAHVQTIDQMKEQFRARDVIEYRFRDSWHFNIAVYRIDRLLGLHLVPVSVQRTWNGRRGAFTWWVDDVMMDEGGRLAKNLSAPDARCWSEQMRLLRLLDQLIDNSDRNLGNLLITTNWRAWAIDHTRAFRYAQTPRNPERLTGIDRTVFDRLQALDFPTLKRAVDGHISDADIRLLLARRDAIVAHFKGLGEAAFYDRRDPAAGCPAPGR
jgi:hypothetical protein